MPTKHLSEHLESRQKLRARFGSSLTRLNLNAINYWLFQCSASVVVLCNLTLVQVFLL